jgi:hypothetical protein
MAVVSGIKEKVHLPIYDSIHIEPEKQLRDIETSSKLRFFVNVQGKTRLETNLQAASLLSHYNTFEARAMRVVISDLPPAFPGGTGSNVPTISDERDVFGLNGEEEGPLKFVANATVPTPPVNINGAGAEITAEFEFTLKRAIELLREARQSPEGTVEVELDDDDVTLSAGTTELDESETDLAAEIGEPLTFSVGELEELIQDTEQIPERQQPPLEQIRPNDGAGNLISKLIFNTVTTFYVGEKIMIEMPTWFFPGGAGAYSEGGRVITHGEPSPAATFRFAEPIYIDKQQNFRVELEIPDADTLKELQRIYGPLFIWVVLDGYMTRDVQ